MQLILELKRSKYDYILITAVDEIFPIIAINEMLNLAIKNDFDFVSGTRYSKGGKRLGGSLIGSILSRTANKLFNLLSNIPLTDCTTGIKLLKKGLGSIQLEVKTYRLGFCI